MNFAKNFYLDRNGRGFVEAGVRGTEIHVVVGMDEGKIQESRDTEDYERTCEPDSIWSTEMERCAREAERKVREEWKAVQDKRAKRKRGKSR